MALSSSLAALKKISDQVSTGTHRCTAEPGASASQNPDPTADSAFQNLFTSQFKEISLFQA
jgi:hypothetical protein